jgi:hypothetical protein
VSASVDRVRPWSGELPRGWGATPLGYLVRTVGGSTPSKDEPAFWNGDIPWVTPKDMKRDVLSDSQDHVSVLATLSLRVLQPPVVLTVVRGMILAHTVPVATTAAPVTINQDMKALLPGASLSTGYLAWTLRAFQDGLLALVETAGHGTCKLSTELWRKFLIPVPPVAAQRAIASFLDRKTAAIDALIEKKERLIALLEEKRQALITQAVTKGLDPSVPMKESGIEWLGEIPAHWTMSALRWIRFPGTSITYGIVQAGPHVPDGVPYIRVSDMSGEELPLEGYQCTSHEIDAAYARSRVRAGDLVVADQSFGRQGPASSHCARDREPDARDGQSLGRPSPQPRLRDVVPAGRIVPGRTLAASQGRNLQGGDFGDTSQTSTPAAASTRTGAHRDAHSRGHKTSRRHHRHLQTTGCSPPRVPPSPDHRRRHGSAERSYSARR